MKITEAMAEIKLFIKKHETQRQFIARNLKREDWRKDPFEKDGTTQETQVASAIQAINDLEKNIVKYRFAIAKANMSQTITIEGITMTVAEWLIWRREVEPLRRILLQALEHGIVLDNPMLVPGRLRATEVALADKTNYIINISEKDLQEEIHKLDLIDERLDGQLSLLNANVDIVL